MFSYVQNAAFHQTTRKVLMEFNVQITEHIF
jgi:hypothetical protein